MQGAMGLVPKTREHATLRLIALALACGVPFASYIATASAHDYWLDSAEFVAAARNLGIAHPPGHPLNALVSHLFTFLPVGSLSFRTAIASALFAAVGAGALFRAIETTILAMDIRSSWVSLPLALGASWLCSCSPGVWQQAIRPEVYALHACLAFVAIERIVQLESDWPSRDVRPLYTAALCVGLALANHHFLAFLLFPVMAPSLARVQRAHGTRPLLISAALVGLGLLTYLYLPLRAAQNPTPNLGAPTDLARMVWVVSAQAFQHTSGISDQPLGERIMDVVVHLVETMHLVPLILGAGGIYTLFRVPGAKRLAWIWGALLVFTIVARAWLGFVRSNPDALGYLIPAFGSVAALVAVFVAKLLAFLRKSERHTEGASAIFVALLLCVVSGAYAARTPERVSLAHFAATDEFDDVRRRDVPYGAIVIAHQPATIFRFWGSETADRTRPDVMLLPLPFLTYPGMVDDLVTRAPELGPLIRNYLLDGELRASDLQSLAAERTVLIEPDVRLSQETLQTLIPAGGLFEAPADGASETDERVGRSVRQRTLTRIYARLGRGLRDPETRATLLWTHYMDALYYAAVGDRVGARDALDHALAIDPLDASLLALDGVVRDESARGAMDVRRFLETRSQPRNARD